MKKKPDLRVFGNKSNDLEKQIVSLLAIEGCLMFQNAGGSTTGMRRSHKQVPTAGISCP